MTKDAGMPLRFRVPKPAIKPAVIPKPPTLPRAPTAPSVPRAPAAPAAPRAPGAPGAPAPPRPAGGFGGIAAGLGLGAAVPALSALLPSITQLGAAGIAAQALPETLTAAGAAIGQTVSATGAAVSGLLQDNPLLTIGLVGAVGLVTYRQLSG